MEEVSRFLSTFVVLEIDISASDLLNLLIERDIFRELIADLSSPSADSTRSQRRISPSSILQKWCWPSKRLTRRLELSIETVS